MCDWRTPLAKTSRDTNATCTFGPSGVVATVRKLCSGNYEL